MAPSPLLGAGVGSAGVLPQLIEEGSRGLHRGGIPSGGWGVSQGSYRPAGTLCELRFFCLGGLAPPLSITSFDVPRLYTAGVNFHVSRPELGPRMVVSRSTSSSLSRTTANEHPSCCCSPAVGLQVRFEGYWEVHARPGPRKNQGVEGLPIHRLTIALPLTAWLYNYLAFRSWVFRVGFESNLQTEIYFLRLLHPRGSRFVAGSCGSGVGPQPDLHLEIR